MLAEDSSMATVGIGQEYEDFFLELLVLVKERGIEISDDRVQPFGQFQGVDVGLLLDAEYNGRLAVVGRGPAPGRRARACRG